MDDDELRQRIAELRAKRGGRMAALPAPEEQPPSREAKTSPAEETALSRREADMPALPPVETYTVEGNGEYYRKEAAPPARPYRRAERRTEYRPPDWDPTEPEEEPRRRKDDGIWGVLTMQGILALVVAILYVALSAFAPAAAQISLGTVRDKSVNDFSFRDALYDMVGEAITTLNQLMPLPVESEPADGGASVPAVSNDTPADTDPEGAPDAGGSAADGPGSSVEPPAGVLPEGGLAASLNGAGGPFSPVDGYVMPEDATFAPIVFTGSLVFPIKGGGRQTAIFGFRENPIHGGLEFHDAVDIAAAKGTNVLAAFDGVVAASGEDRYLGNRILLDHGDGFYTVYGHCDRLVAKEGAHIRAGEVIAKVGSTGDSTGYHLHFGMRMDGLWFDPAWLFPDVLAPGGVEEE